MINHFPINSLALDVIFKFSPNLKRINNTQIPILDTFSYALSSLKTACSCPLAI